ncbi:MAG: hypothetical protein QOF43_2020 [Gaiellaceae bacterium]|nr:hypothetical protein [Gaiellaceae bacterium]
MDVPKPVWTTSSFLLYVGGFTVLGATIAGLAILANDYSKGAFVAWILLPLAVLLAIALAFRRRGEWIAAGLFAFAAVAMAVSFAGSLLDWWGWLPANQDSPYQGWNWGTWLLALLIIAIAVAALRAFRFPLILLFVVGTAYYLVVDILSGGGSWSAVLTLLVGFLYLIVGVSLDRGPRRPYGFWVHVTAGLLVGGALLYWWHSSETDWWLIAAAALVYIGIAGATRRSSWAVFGAAALLAVTGHFVAKWSDTGFSPLAPAGRTWVGPVVFSVVGFVFVLLGLRVERRRRDAAPLPQA